MNYLQESSLIAQIQAHANDGGKIIAICLGLQLLFRSSDESPGVEGLNIIGGSVSKISAHPDFHVPHIGWNSLSKTDFTPDSLSQFFDQSGVSYSDYYFVHSYYATPSDIQASIATISHPCGLLDVAFLMNNVYAFQFHPEKSGPNGYKLLGKILDL